MSKTGILFYTSLISLILSATPLLSQVVVIDSIVFKNQNQNISFGFQPDGGVEGYSFIIPTPGLSNTGDLYLKNSVPGFSLQAGFYTEEQMLEISTEDTLAVIRFTTNGDEPTASSSIYTEPIPIVNRSGEPNVYSEIRTNKDPYRWLPDGIPPEGEVFKGRFHHR